MTKDKIFKAGSITALLATLAAISGCAPGAETGEGSSILPFVIFLVVIFGLMYLVMIRPQRKRQKEHQELVQQLNKGDQVVTAGGIYGSIESLSEESIVIKVESGATMRVARGSVALKREK